MKMINDYGLSASTYKKELMGISMIMVLLCHMPVIPITILNIFTPGMIGCDIFIFLSGYSLGYSLQKNSLAKFYVRRMARIYPLFLIMAILKCLIIYNFVKPLSFWEVINGFTLLSYYTNLGGVVVDWYLSICFLFYLLFPLLFMVPRNILIMLAIIGMTVVQILYSQDIILIKDNLACGLARFPMFCWGIWLFKTIENQSRFSRNDMLIHFFWILPLSLAIVFKCHFYYICDLVAPYLLLLLIYICQALKRKCITVSSFLNRLGNYTLEIYIANIISYTYCRYLAADKVMPISVTLIGGTIILSLLLIRANVFIQKRLRPLTQ